MNNSTKIPTLFLGTPEFSVPFLKILKSTKLSGDFQLDIKAIITQPDKPVGRHYKVQPTPVKIAAQELKLPVITELEAKKIKELNPDLIVVVAYGKLIPQEILSMPKYGCINIHPSLLPKYRGPSPIQSAILNGDTETGITLMLLDSEMDHGPIIAQKKMALSGQETGEILHDRLATEGAQFLIDSLPDYLLSKAKPVPQNHDQATFSKILKREDGKIDWQKSATEIEQQVRAFTSWPGAYTQWAPSTSLRAGKSRLKILSVSVLPHDDNKKTGQVFEADSKPAVACENGVIILEKVQPEGKGVMSGEEFLRGYEEIINKILG